MFNCRAYWKRNDIADNNLIHLFFSEMLLKSAKVIKTAMFNAIKFADVTKTTTIVCRKEVQPAMWKQYIGWTSSSYLWQHILRKTLVKMNYADKSNVESAKCYFFLNLLLFLCKYITFEILKLSCENASSKKLQNFAKIIPMFLFAFEFKKTCYMHCCTNG